MYHYHCNYLVLARHCWYVIGKKDGYKEKKLPHVGGSGRTIQCPCFELKLLLLLLLLQLFAVVVVVVDVVIVVVVVGVVVVVVVGVVVVVAI